MSSTTSARDIYLQGVRNAHGEETQTVQAIERQINRLEHYPELKALLQRQHSESQQQAQRLEQILGTHDTSTSAVKETVTGLVGSAAAAIHGAMSDEVLKNTFSNYAMTHHAIASYTSLIAMAEAAGDGQHVPLIRESLQEEEAMAKVMEAQIVPLTQRYMQLTETGETAKA
jgi:ferritin-like metal-binding protein YciE